MPNIPIDISNVIDEFVKGVNDMVLNGKTSQTGFYSVEMKLNIL